MQAFDCIRDEGKRTSIAGERVVQSLPLRDRDRVAEADFSRGNRPGNRHLQGTISAVLRELGLVRTNKSLLLLE